MKKEDFLALGFEETIYPNTYKKDEIWVYNQDDISIRDYGGWRVYKADISSKKQFKQVLKMLRID